MAKDPQSHLDNVKKTITKARELKLLDEKPTDKHRMRAVMYMAALGFSSPEISRNLSMAPATTKRFLKSDSVQKGIEKIQYEMFMKDPQKMFMAIVPRAVSTAKEIMEDANAKDSVRLDAAFKFMDRAMGRPTQHIDHSGNLIKDVLSAIIKMDSTQKPEIEIESKPEDTQEAVEKRSVDDWIDKNITNL